MTSPENPDRPKEHGARATDEASVITRRADHGAGTQEGERPVRPAASDTNGTTATETSASVADVLSGQAPPRPAEAHKHGGDGHDEGQRVAGGAEDTTVAPSAPPPWQRAPGAERPEHPTVSYGARPGPAQHGAGGGYSEQGGSHYAGAGYGSPRASDLEMPTVAVPRPSTVGPAVGAFGTQATTKAAGTSAPQGAGSSQSGAARATRGPRRASLQVKRVDPWSVLKLALVLSVAVFFCWLVAVGVLYGVLGGMGVWDKLNGTYNDLVQGGGGAANGPLISAGRVFGVAAIIGAINIVLFTALATVGAFVYNVSADLAGGLEVTLSERE